MSKINIKLIVGILALVVIAISIRMMVAYQDAKEIMVIQSAVSGNLTVFTDPGPHGQYFGKVTTYKRRIQYSFSAAKDQGTAGDQSIKTGFNDGGAGYISGVVSWEMPLKPEQIVRLHKEYGSEEAIDQQLIRPMLEKVIFSAGATMSSIESSAERRAEIPQVIDDQLQNGPYLTKTVTITQKDAISGQDKPVRAVQIEIDKDGKPLRASASTIKEYGITLSPVTVNDIAYSKEVAAQIAERQTLNQAVQISIATALRATQDAITTAKQGEATAATAKWAQEALKATAVVKAQQGVEVATLAAKEAEQYKKEQILRGEGDAERKRLVMAADGALDPKLKAYVEVNTVYAKAIGDYQGNWVPGVVMGDSKGGSHNGAQELVDMLTAKTAKDLGLSFNVQGQAATAKPGKK